MNVRTMLILASDPKRFPEFLCERWWHAYDLGYVTAEQALAGIEADEKLKQEFSS